MNYEYSSYLAHHGVKGMRWGHRKEEESSARWKARDARNLTNEELDRRNQRLQKENQYRSNVENAHPVKKELKQAAKKIMFYSAVGALSGVMGMKYRSGANFIGQMSSYKLPL